MLEAARSQPRRWALSMNMLLSIGDRRHARHSVHLEAQLMHKPPPSINRRLLHSQANVTRRMRAWMQPQACDHAPTPAAWIGSIADVDPALPVARIMAGAAQVQQQGVDQGHGVRMLIIEERVSQFWAVPFDQILAILPYLEVAAVDALNLAQQRGGQLQAPVLGFLQPGARITVCSVAAATGLRGQTFSYARP
jgi:hypothetical protein